MDFDPKATSELTNRQHLLRLQPPSLLSMEANEICKKHLQRTLYCCCYHSLIVPLGSARTNFEEIDLLAYGYVTVAVTTSSIAIVFNIYWEIFKEWVLMNRKYKNYKKHEMMSMKMMMMMVDEGGEEEMMETGRTVGYLGHR
ncbi:hypothetical protein YC2023_070911 [Brassica napus]